MDSVSLRALLRRLGRRELAIGLVAGCEWGLLAAGLLALAGMWFDLVVEFSPAGRLKSLAIAALGGAGLVLAFVWLARRRTAPEELAKRLDGAVEASGQIRAGVDLLMDRRALPALSAGLGQMAVDRAEVLARGVPGRRVAPARPLVAGSVAIGLFVAGAAVVTLAMPRLARTQWLRFTDPFGDHPPFSPVVFRVEPGDVKVVYGRGVDIRVVTEGAPVDRLELVLEAGDSTRAAERLPMFPEVGRAWRASVVNVTAGGRYFVRSHGARSPRYRIEVITVPRLTGVRFRVTPPAYTNRPATEGPLPRGGLAGLPGTKVAVWAASNRPLTSGTLLLRTGRSQNHLNLTTTGGAGSEVFGAFEIRASGSLEIQVDDVAHQHSQESFVAPITALRDERPFIRILEPREVSFATPDASLPVVLSAEDDYGISRVQLFRALNGSRAMPTDVPLGLKAPLRWYDQVALPLAAYSLRPGDVIQLYARVEDNDPAGPKGSESSVVMVRIISPEVFERLVRARAGMEALASKYREGERRLEALAEETAGLQERLAQLLPDSELSQSLKSEIEHLNKRMRDEAAALRESARHPLPYDIDRELSRELDRLAEGLEQMANEAESLDRSPGLKGGTAAEAIAQLQRRLAVLRKAFTNEALEPIEHLARVFPLLEDEARFEQLYLRQRDLAQRLASLKGHDGQDNPQLRARMRDLEEEQRLNRTELAQLLDDIENHARLLPADAKLDALRRSAEVFATAVRASGASEAMADAEAGLAEFSGTRGAESARNAADILERFLAQCKGGIGEPCRGALKFQPKLANCLGNTIEQLLADAGFKRPGAGPGFGVGNGYSARQSNLNNVGLYGRLPTLTASATQGSGHTQSGPGQGRQRGSTDTQRPAGLIASRGQLSAAGQADVPIPVEYRRRVAEYLQRLADEMSDR